MNREQTITELDSLLLLHRGLLNESEQNDFSRLLLEAREMPDVDEEGNESPLPIELVRLGKILQLRCYDQSSDVLSFSLNGVSMWLNPQQRVNYLMTIDAAEENGMTAVPFGGAEIPISYARTVLNAVALYAMQTMAVTDAHAAAIRALQTIAEIDAYDFTVGYPERLVF